jgi:heptaprenyl diphosphate synthase
MLYRDDIVGSRGIAATALLLAIATVLGYVEAVLMPAPPIPGLKFGLANIAVVIALAVLGPWHAALVSFGRVFLVGLATGTLAGPTTALALTGAVAAWAVMSLMARQERTFSVVGWSVAGACAHASGQLVAAVFVTGSPAPIMLLPYALGLSIVTGVAIGLLAYLLLSRVPTLRLAYEHG